MSTYVMEVRQPHSELCPFHKVKFKKKGKFWHCPFYGDCGHSIGSRPLVGQVNRLWMRQTKKGKAWVKAYFDNIRRCTEILPEPEPAAPPAHPVRPSLLVGVAP